MPNSCRCRLPTSTKTSVDECSWWPVRLRIRVPLSSRQGRTALGRGLRHARVPREHGAGGSPAPDRRNRDGDAGVASRILSRALERILAVAHEYDAVVLGPGLTLADGAVVVARGLVAQLDRPLVVDADALNALVDAVDLVSARRSPTVLTPHPGEMDGCSAYHRRVQADRVEAADGLATFGATWFSRARDGRVGGWAARDRVVRDAGARDRGYGDVLSGVIGALLATGLSALDAAALVRTGTGGREAAAAALTPLSVTAEDIPGFLPIAAASFSAAGNVTVRRIRRLDAIEREGRKVRHG